MIAKRERESGKRDKKRLVTQSENYRRRYMLLWDFQ